MQILPALTVHVVVQMGFVVIRQPSVEVAIVQ